MIPGKKIWLLIVLSSFLRLILAGSLELGNDEAYYQTYAIHLQWSYFDHPPLVAWLIRLSTVNLFLHQELFIRLGSVCCAAIGTWLIYKIGIRINGVRTGWIAAILYNTSFYTSVISGTLILPDSPLVVFWLLSLYFMIRILEKPANKNQTLFFILLGLSIGLCILSKIHGIFLWLGLGGYILFHRRDLLRSPMLWVAVLVTLLMISPLFIWNINNHFITYQYHQGRIGFWGNKPDMDHLLQQVLGSVFYSNPINFILYILSLTAIVKGKIKCLPDGYPLFLWLSLPLIGLLLWASLFSETLPHWSGPAYLSLMIVAAIWLDEKADSSYVPKWLSIAGWVYATVVLLGLASIPFLPFRIGSTEEKNLGRGDITLDMSGWKHFARCFDSLYRSDIASQKMKKNATLISDYWFPAGHLDHYCSLPYHHNLLVFGPVNDIHHFAWLNQQRPRLIKGSDAYFIYTSNYYGPPGNSIKENFTRVEDSLIIPQFRNGIIVRYFVIYRMHDFTGDSLDYLIPGIR